jgi:hypothetical protein
MSYRRSALYRFRGLLVLAVFCISIFFLTSSHRASTQSADDFPSVIQWIKDGGYEILLPTTQDVKRSRGTSTATRATNLATHINTGAGTGTADKPPASTTKTPESSSTSRDDSDEAVYLLEEPNPHQKPMDPLEREFFSWRGDEYEMKKKPASKPPRQPGQPIPDPFPLLSQKSPAEVRRMLQVPDINRPPKPHVPEDTPLLIGFTRNWPQLLQCVSSYITAGWPPEDIYVVENTGVMFSNRDNLLSLQNPFYMNHTQLQMLGVNVIVAPTLLTFAQLQNFYAWTALERNWTDFFWSHQDVVAFSFEKEFRPHTDGFNDISNYSLYTRAVAILRYLRQPAIPKWAHHFFAYDHLTLVHRDAILDVGGWDTHIPFYATDCDMYDRLQVSSSTLPTPHGGGRNDPAYTGTNQMYSMHHSGQAISKDRHRSASSSTHRPPSTTSRPSSVFLGSMPPSPAILTPSRMRTRTRTRIASGQPKSREHWRG